MKLLSEISVFIRTHHAPSFIFSPERSQQCVDTMKHFITCREIKHFSGSS
jgi:hypothetical protein